VVALDGTKVAASVATTASHILGKIEREVAEILRQAAEADQREDLEHGQARGDEPEGLASKAGRLARLRQAMALLEAEAAGRQHRYEQRVAELAAAARARGKQPRARIRPRRRDEAPNPRATANVTDPDSRLMATRRGSIQGYNAQAVTTLEQVIVAAELTQQANDLQQLEPMLAATATTLGAAGIRQRPGMLLADSGYWTIANLTAIPDAPELLIPPARHGRQGKPRKDGKPAASRSDGLRAAMNAKLASDDGRACYALRKETVEPVFGQLKEQQGARRFLRRGLAACEAEWKLLYGTHNLLKLWRHRTMPPSAQPGPHLSRDPGPDAAGMASAVYRAGAAPAALPRPGMPPTTCPRRLSATGSYASTGTVKHHASARTSRCPCRHRRGRIHQPSGNVAPAAPRTNRHEEPPDEQHLAIPGQLRQQPISGEVALVDRVPRTVPQPALLPAVTLHALVGGGVDHDQLGRDPARLGQERHPLDLDQMAVEVTGNQPVEGRVAERQGGDHGPHRLRGRDSAPGNLEHALALVQCHHVAAEVPGKQAGPAGHVKHATGRQPRQDAAECGQLAGERRDGVSVHAVGDGLVVLGGPPLVVLLPLAHTPMTAQSPTTRHPWHHRSQPFGQL
jgi:Transposase DDE domain